MKLGGSGTKLPNSKRIERCVRGGSSYSVPLFDSIHITPDLVVCSYLHPVKFVAIFHFGQFNSLLTPAMDQFLILNSVISLLVPYPFCIVSLTP